MTATQSSRIKGKDPILLAEQTQKALWFLQLCLLFYPSKKIELNNDLPDDMMVDPIDCSQLSYSDGKEGENNPVSKTANSNSNRRQQCISNKDLALSRVTNSQGHVYNMQILYNINQVLSLGIVIFMPFLFMDL